MRSLNNHAENLADKRLRILHVDMDAFFASIEQRDNPDLRGKPVIVGAGPHERGVVATASYEARKFGVRSAMPSVKAGRLCPEGVFIPCNHAKYNAVSQEIFRIFNRYTPFVEALSCDEAFLDVGGSFRLFGDAPTIAAKIRADIRAETRLTASVGVAVNKFLAKLASDMNKPDGITIVPVETEAIQHFLAPLPVRAIPGVGEMAAHVLAAAGIKTVGNVQNTPAETLKRLLGVNYAEHLLRLSFGQDSRIVSAEREEKSISNEYTFPEDTADRQKVRERLLFLASKVGRRVRAAGKHASTAKIKIRWADFKTITRQKKFPAPACDDISYRKLAAELFEAESRDFPVRLIGFGVSGFAAGAHSPALFETADDGSVGKREKLCAAVDAARRDLEDGGVIAFGPPEEETTVKDGQNGDLPPPRILNRREK